MLPDAWIDALFARLTLRYGAAFLRQWPDIDPDAIKADWRSVLANVTGEAIAYGLENLPADRPPNAMQFRALCNRVPTPGQAALPAPTYRPGVDLLHAMARKATTIGQERARVGETVWCIRRIDAIVASRGGRISEAQRHVRASCVRVLGYDPAVQDGPTPAPQAAIAQPAPAGAYQEA